MCLTESVAGVVGNLLSFIRLGEKYLRTCPKTSSARKAVFIFQHMNGSGGYNMSTA
jgi:hypothetical protein